MKSVVSEYRCEPHEMALFAVVSEEAAGDW